MLLADLPPIFRDAHLNPGPILSNTLPRLNVYALMQATLLQFNDHHLLIQHSLPESCLIAFIQGFNAACETQDWQFLLFDWDENRVGNAPQNEWLNAVDKLKQLADLATEVTCLVFFSWPEKFLNFAKSLLKHPNLRCIILSKNKITKTEAFKEINLPLNAAEEIQFKLLFIKQIEKYQRLKITGNLLELADLLAQRYFVAPKRFLATLTLLDRAAAIAHLQAETIVSEQHLVAALSLDLNLPTQVLQVNKFQPSVLETFFKQRLVAKEDSLEALWPVFNAYALHPDRHPLRLIFAGPQQSGKRYTATKLADFWVGKERAFFIVTCYSELAINDYPVQEVATNRSYSLKQALQQAPFGVFLFLQTERLSTIKQEELARFLATGIAVDMTLDLSLAVIILSITTAEVELPNTTPTPESQALDFLQLLKPALQPELAAGLNEKSNSELITELLPQLPDCFTKHFSIIPFTALTAKDLKMILQVGLNELQVHIQHTYQVTLHYAPEVLDFLLQDASKKMEKILQSVTEQIQLSLASHNLQTLRQHDLQLQLNETGEVLHCLWIKRKQTMGLV